MNFRPFKRVHLTRTQRLLIETLSLGIIVLAGLALRLYLSPHPGYEFDVGVNQGWGRSAVELGLAQSYVEQINGNMLPNYAPFSIMLFTAMAYLQQWIYGGFDGVDPHTYRVLIKLPAIFADLLTVITLFFALRRWKSPKAGYIAAVVFAFHPAAFHESAIWGQTDSIFTLFMVLATYLFAVRRPMLAGMMFALALLSKMQAVMLLPFFFILYVRGGWRMFLDGLLGGLLVTVPVMIPFAIGGTFDAVVDVYLNSVGFYAIVSSAAYNLWWSLLADQAGSIEDTQLLLGLLSYRNIGFILFSLSYLWTLATLWKHLRPSRSDMKGFPAFFLATAFLCLCFFMWNTQMHERYLFPFIALGLPFAFINMRGALLYGFISLFFYLNLLGWLPAGSFDKTLYETFPTLDVFVASGQVILSVQLAHYLWSFRKHQPVPPPGKKRQWKLMKHLQGVLPKRRTA